MNIKKIILTIIILVTALLLVACSKKVIIEGSITHNLHLIDPVTQHPTDEKADFNKNIEFGKSYALILNFDLKIGNLKKNNKATNKRRKEEMAKDRIFEIDLKNLLDDKQNNKSLVAEGIFGWSYAKDSEAGVYSIKTSLASFNAPLENKSRYIYLRPSVEMINNSQENKPYELKLTLKAEDKNTTLNLDKAFRGDSEQEAHYIQNLQVMKGNFSFDLYEDMVLFANTKYFDVEINLPLNTVGVELLFYNTENKRLGSKKILSALELEENIVEPNSKILSLKIIKILLEVGAFENSDFTGEYEYNIIFEFVIKGEHYNDHISRIDLLLKGE